MLPGAELAATGVGGSMEVPAGPVFSARVETGASDLGGAAPASPAVEVGERVATCFGGFGTKEASTSTLPLLVMLPEVE